MFEIARILFKHLTIGLNAKENLRLDAWRKADYSHEELYQKLASYAFWQEASSEKHRCLECKQWEFLYQKVEKIRRRRRILLLRRYAAIIIPFIMFIVLWSENDTKKVLVGRIPLQYKLGDTSLRAVIHFADNSSFVIKKDSLFQLKQKGTVLKNVEDTLIICATDTEISAGSFRVEVPVGGNYITRLEDGSIVHMDAASTLIVPSHFARTSREVELYGHAYFIVKPDSLRPFIVRANGVYVRVLGTEFDLNAYQVDELKTTLVKGLVEIRGPVERVLLKPLQQAIINQQGNIFIEEVEIYPVVAWKDNRIVFVNERLEEIMVSLKRWYGIDYLFLNDVLKEECFTLDIDRYKTVDVVLASIARTNKVKFTVNGKQILIQEK